MTTKTIVVLANSVKKSGRCLAGREIVRAGSAWRVGNWIRPVTSQERLLRLVNQEHPSLFASHPEQIEQAYEQHGLKIAYRQTDTRPEIEYQPASAS